MGPLRALTLGVVLALCRAQGAPEKGRPSSTHIYGLIVSDVPTSPSPTDPTLRPTLRPAPHPPKAYTDTDTDTDEGAEVLIQEPCWSDQRLHFGAAAAEHEPQAWAIKHAVSDIIQHQVLAMGIPAPSWQGFSLPAPTHSPAPSEGGG